MLLLNEVGRGLDGLGISMSVLVLVTLVAHTASSCWPAERPWKMEGDGREEMKGEGECEGGRWERGNERGREV